MIADMGVENNEGTGLVPLFKDVVFHIAQAGRFTVSHAPRTRTCVQQLPETSSARSSYFAWFWAQAFIT